VRCDVCNVDLGEEYARCPLCGAGASAAEPVLEGLRTSAYPAVACKKWYENAFLMFVCAYAGISVLSFLIDLIANGRVMSSLWVVFATPCVWSLLLRPFLVKKLRFGSYIMCDALCLSLLILWACRAYTGSFSTAVSIGVPLVSGVSAIFLIVGLLLFRDPAVKSLTFFLALGGANLALAAISAVMGYSFVAAIVAVLLCIAPVAGLAARFPAETREELAARFSF